MTKTMTSQVVVRRAKLRHVDQRDGAPEKRQRTWTDVAMDVKARISDGTYAPGMQLPSLRDREAYGAAQVTVRRAMQYLEGIGVVEIRDRSGYYVRTQPDVEQDKGHGDTAPMHEARIADLERRVAELEREVRGQQ